MGVHFTSLFKADMLDLFYVHVLRLHAAPYPHPAKASRT